MRYFAEAPWYPNALLPSQGEQGAMVHASSAKAGLMEGAITLTLLFHFNEMGLIDCQVPAGCKPASRTIRAFPPAIS